MWGYLLRALPFSLLEQTRSAVEYGSYVMWKDTSPWKQITKSLIKPCMFVCFFLILNNEKKLCYDFMKVNLSMIMKSELIIAKAMM